MQKEGLEIAKCDNGMPCTRLARFFPKIVARLPENVTHWITKR